MADALDSKCPLSRPYVETRAGLPSQVFFLIWHFWLTKVSSGRSWLVALRARCARLGVVDPKPWHPEKV